MLCAPPFSILCAWPSLYRGQASGTVAELAAMYQAQPTSEALFLALCGELDGVLCNLAFEYQAAPNDVLYALMEASKRPLVNDDATQELRGRIRGLLQEQNEREARRTLTLGAYVDSGLHPAHTKPTREDLSDLKLALLRLSEKHRRVISLAESGVTDKELVELGLAKNPMLARSLLKDARNRLASLLGIIRKKKSHR